MKLEMLHPRPQEMVLLSLVFQINCECSKSKNTSIPILLLYTLHFNDNKFQCFFFYFGSLVSQMLGFMITIYECTTCTCTPT